MAAPIAQGARNSSDEVTEAEAAIRLIVAPAAVESKAAQTFARGESDSGARLLFFKIEPPLVPIV